MKKTNKLIFWISLFAIAMGFMESAVVIYLREIYYKTGFDFPLRPIETHLAKVEFIRELATIIMLIGTGYLAGKNTLQRFAYFCYSFAIWDLFYYVFLYVFLNWPSSLFTWDILFLIPFPWVGPVWAPCLISLLMIVGALFIIRQIDTNDNFKIPFKYWVILIAGALICIISFMLDYMQATSGDKLWNIFSKELLFDDFKNYVPEKFNSTLFFIGFLAMTFPVALQIYNNSKFKHYEKK